MTPDELTSSTTKTFNLISVGDVQGTLEPAVKDHVRG
jgi:hypothetical protein